MLDQREPSSPVVAASPSFAKFWGMLFLLIITLTVACVPVGRQPEANPPATPTIEPTPKPTPTAQPPTPTSLPLHLILWESLDADQRQRLIQDAAAFTADHPHVSIDIQHYASEGELKRALERGTVDFDLVLANSSLVEIMRAQGLILPVDEVFAEDFFYSFAESGLEGINWGEKAWGVPHSLGLGLVLFYNKELLSEPPQDTVSMIEVAEKFTGQERYGLAMNYRDPLWLIPWLSGFGGWLVDKGGQPQLNTVAMVDALHFLRDLKFEHQILPSQIDYGIARDLFLESRAAMLIDGGWALASYEESEGLSLGLAPLPQVTETGLAPAPLVTGRYFAVGAHLSDGKREAARLFIERMTDPRLQLEWAREFGVLPAHKQALADDFIQGDPMRRTLASQILAGRGVGLGLSLPALLEAMRLPLEEVMSGRRMPTEAARQMQERVEKSMGNSP